MLTDKSLLEDKAKIQEAILGFQETIAFAQQELQHLQSQLVRHTGALDYIKDNLKPKPKPKEVEQCTEEI